MKTWIKILFVTVAFAMNTTSAMAESKAGETDSDCTAVSGTTTTEADTTADQTAVTAPAAGSANGPKPEVTGKP